ncbi:MAG: YraN family protein [Mariprofundaceae bacterium]
MSTDQGRKGEDRAAKYLKRRGYQVLDRNIRLGRGELDIVARHNDILAFVEVKAHKTHESGVLAVHSDKQQRLWSAANAYLGRHPEFATLQCRFDLIILTPARGLNPWPRIEHMLDVFRC